MTDPRAWLAEVQERASKATAGPWTPMEFDDDPHDWGVAILGGGEMGTMDAHLTAYTMTMNDVEQTEADAEFIAHARTEHPAMAAALTAVLDLHKPTPGYWGEEICAECSDDDSRVEYSHPCPTVQAVADALGGDRG